MKLLLSKKSKKRMKRAFFLFMAILFFCSSIFPSLGVARTSSPSIDDQIHISEGSRVEMEPLVATGTRSPEATDEEELEYDPQPETKEEVQEWIDKYLESDNDKSEKPNWEEEVDEELMPEGWKADFVEDGDEYFGKDYYTIFLDYDPQPEKIEEVRDWIKIYLGSDNDASEKPNWEEEVKESLIPNGWEIAFIEDGDDYFDGDYYTFDLIYDPQPETIEEVRDQIKDYVQSDEDPSEKPNWEEEVEEDIIPNGWVVEFVEDGDEHFEADYYTLSVDYDSQPETIEEVREWIKKYLESDKDPSERPNWEKEVDEKLMPNGWEVEFVEEGDEYFEADYYTISLRYDSQPETIEEVREWIKKYLESDKDPSERPNWEKEVDKDIMPNGWGVEFVGGGDEHFEADYYTISLNYDPQPETIEEVQEWIDRYEESDNDKSEKPNWEKEVDEELMPDGWYNDLVEGGDEHFEADYYTIFQEDEEREEVAEETEEEYLEYDPQPTTKEEVQEWIDAHIAANYSESSKPRWQYEVDASLMPDDWKCNDVEDDRYSEGLYWTIFPNFAARAAARSGAGTIVVSNLDNATVVTFSQLSEAIKYVNGGNATASDTNTYTGNATDKYKVDVQTDINLEEMLEITNTGGVTITGGKTITRTTANMGKDSSRHFKVSAGNLTLANITLDGGYLQNGANAGGGVWVVGGIFNMNTGATIQNCYRKEFALGEGTGGGVFVESKGKFTLDGGTIVNNAAETSGGGVSVNDGVFEMKSGLIEGNESVRSGGGVYVTGVQTDENNPNTITRAKFNMSGGTIKDNKTVTDITEPITTEEGAAQATVKGLSNGGGVAVVLSEFNLSGDAKISGNNASHIGGGVFADDNSIVKMEGNAEISNNETETWDGGILIHWNSTFEMHGGRIINNTSVFNGGGVGIISSDFEMTDGLIAGNQTTATGEQGVATGGGVMVGKSDIRPNGAVGTFIMSGGIITGNVAVDSGGGVSIEDGSKFELTGDGIIGGPIPKDQGVIPITYEYEYEDENGDPKPGSITVKIGNYTHDAGGGVNVQAGSEFTMSGGKIIQNQSNLTGGGVYVVGTNHATSDNDGGFTPSTFNMTGGLIEDNHTTYSDPLDEDEAAVVGVEALANGGGVALVRSEFIMSDNAKINNNSAQHIGGGVFAHDYSTVTMEDDAVISNNTTETWDGGILIHWKSTFEMNGGRIINNTSVYNGGGVGIISSNFEMTDGLIAGNKTTSDTDSTGGGVMIGKSDIMGDVHVPSYFKMSGGKITGNMAMNSGGGVSVEDGSKFEMVMPAGGGSEGPVIGGPVPIDKEVEIIEYTREGIDGDGNPILIDMEVSTGNHTAAAGGGVNIQGASIFNMKGGYIRGNASEYSGGGVYVIATKYRPLNDPLGSYYDEVEQEDKKDRSTFNMSGGTIYNNTTLSDIPLDEQEAAEKGVGNLANGGGVAVIRSDFTMSDTAKIDSNSAQHIGGGVFADDRSIVTMEDDAVISNNTTQTWDGGILIHWKSKFYMNGGRVINNTSVFNGGGVGIISSGFEMNKGLIAGNQTTATDEQGLATAGGVHIGKSDIMGNVGIPISTFEMIDGHITGNHATDAGGGVSIEDGSKFEMKGGIIGGNVPIDKGVTPIMLKDDIENPITLTKGNMTGDRAGGVNVQDGSEFIMTGGAVKGNTTQDPTVTINTSNTNHNYFSVGGGVMIDNKSTFTMAEGGSGDNTTIPEVSGNSSYHHGGGVHVQGASEFTMEAGKISGNTSHYSGGGVYVGYQNFVLKDKDGKDDPMKMDGSVFTMSGGTIEGNKTEYLGKVAKRFLYGGGVHVDKATFNMNGGSIVNNLAAFCGGGVSIASGEFNMTDGNISGNITDSASIKAAGITGTSLYTYGGGVWVGRSYNRSAPDNVPFSTFTMNGGTIGAIGDGGLFKEDYVNENNETVTFDNRKNGNYANESGGGVFLSRGVIFNMYGDAEIKFNHTNNRGGGVYASWGSDWTSGTSEETGGLGSYKAERVPSIFLLNGEGEIAPDGTLQNVTSKSGDDNKPKISNNEALNAGGGVYIAEQTKFHMWDGATITENFTEERGGGVGVLQSYFYMHGGEISNNSSKERGGGVTVAYGIFEMSGGEITDNNTENKAGGVYIGGAVSQGLAFDAKKTPTELANLNVTSYFLMKDGTISGNSSLDTGGGVTVQSKSMFVMGDEANPNATTPVITNNKTTNTHVNSRPYAGGVGIEESTFKMYAGEISHNTTPFAGGGVTLGFGSTFDMKGGEIFQNTASGVHDFQPSGFGGGVVIGARQLDGNDQKSSTFNMEGGSIYNNHAKLEGGGVLISSSDFKMSAGEIISNDTTNAAGGVWVGAYLGTAGARSSTFTMSDGIITGNYARNSGGGVSVADGSEFTMEGGTIGGEVPEAYLKLTHFNLINYEAKHTDGRVLRTGTLETGNRTDEFGGGVNVQGGSTFVMMDGSIIGNYSGSTVAKTGGGGVFVGMPGKDFSETTGTFEMYGGEISNNSTRRSGAGVFIHNKAEFILDGGKIVDNLADSRIDANSAIVPTPFTDTSDGGGGVYVYTGTITMYDGEVSRNETWSAVNNGASGGGIALLDGSIFTMHDGIISDNWASHGGGGVLLNADNEFTMNGGEIVRNIAEGGNEDFMSGGGGVYIFRTGYFTMNGGKINENIAGKNGGGIAVNYPTYGDEFYNPDNPNNTVIRMYGGEINNNRVEGRNQHDDKGYGGGGGVYLYQGATFIMEKRFAKAPEIKYNTAGLGGGVGVEVGKEQQGPFGIDGGGIYVSRGTLNVVSGIIEGNTAVGNGGGIFVNEPTALYPNLVTIGARKDDDGTIIDDPTFIINNTAGGDGGGIYVQRAPGMSYTPNGYTQLTTDATTVFSGNVASKLYNPPNPIKVNNVSYYTENYKTIGFASVSVPELISPEHPLNNYDINFYNPPAIDIFTFTKVDAADDNEKLKGAGFQLYYEEDGVKHYYSEEKEDSGNVTFTWLKQDDDGKWWELDTTTNPQVWKKSDKVPTTVKSGEDGRVIFSNIPAKSDRVYVLTEVKAPPGYQLPQGNWKFKFVQRIGENGAALKDEKGYPIYDIEFLEGDGEVPVAFKNIGTPENPIYYLGNIQNFKLPLTGNGGYWLFALGLLLLAIGLVRILYKKYKDKQNSPSELEKNIE